MALTRAQLHRSASTPVTVGRTSSVNLVDDAEKRLNEEIKQLVSDIRRIGPTYPSPAPCVLFGELFDDEFAQQYYEALIGTLKAAKKRGIIKFKGQMLLKGMHDRVVISIVDESPPPPIAIPGKGKTKKTTSTRAKPSMEKKQNLGSDSTTISSYLSEARDPTASKDDSKDDAVSISSTGKCGYNMYRGKNQYLIENEVPEVAKGPMKHQGGPERTIDVPTSVAEMWTSSSPLSPSPLSSSKAFAFTTYEQKEHQKRVEQMNQSGESSEAPQSNKGNWRPAPWRHQRPLSTTALSGSRTKTKKKDGKRRISAPISRKGDGSKPEMTIDNNSLDAGGGSGRINVNMCSVPEDVTLKAPPNAASRGNGSGGLSKAAAAALGGTPSNSNHSTSKSSAARRFLRSRKSGEGTAFTRSIDSRNNNHVGEEDEASVSSIGGGSIGAVSIASAPARVMRSSSCAAVEAHKARLDEEIDQLLIDIRRVGTNPGEPNVAFGELFDDDDVQNYYEALVGTLKSAKRRGVVNFKGQMLLKGMHDNVMIEIVNP